jgi:hypothetical protein
MNSYQLSYLLSSSSTGIYRRFDGTNISTHHYSHQATARKVTTNKSDVRSFTHGVRSLNRSHKPPCFDHP